MPRIATAARSILSRWRQLLGVAAVLALLSPVPAVAFQFVGQWTFWQFQSGGAPQADVSFADTAAGGSMTIDMGYHDAPGVARSEVTAMRDFVVNSPREAVTIARQFETMMMNGVVDVRVSIQRLTGRSSFRVDPYRAKVGDLETIGQVASDTRTMRRGSYRMVVQVKYRKSKDGWWWNNSPHQFTFAGFPSGPGGGPDTRRSVRDDL